MIISEIIKFFYEVTDSLRILKNVQLTIRTRSWLPNADHIAIFLQRTFPFPLGPDGSDAFEHFKCGGNFEVLIYHHFDMSRGKRNFLVIRLFADNFIEITFLTVLMCIILKKRFQYQNVPRIQFTQTFLGFTEILCVVQLNACFSASQFQLKSLLEHVNFYTNEYKSVFKIRYTAKLNSIVSLMYFLDEIIITM